MHFALPTRGNSRSSPFLTTSAPRSYIPPALRRRPIYGVLLFIVMALLLLKSWGGDRRPADGPHTVLVLVLNRTDHSTEHISRIIENREEYAKAHGRQPTAAAFSIRGAVAAIYISFR